MVKFGILFATLDSIFACGSVDDTIDFPENESVRIEQVEAIEATKSIEKFKEALNTVESENDALKKRIRILEGK